MMIYLTTTGGYHSCLDIQQRANTTSDEEYEMMLGGKNVSIFCHQMNTTWPKEFLTLPTGEAENYSEMYGMRLKAADTCPNNGSRENCPCVKDESPRVGMTAWNKINLNVTSLSINRKLIYIACTANDSSSAAYDFTFTQQLHGMVVPYGEAGDCYSMANCPQGKFSINLTGTGLRVAPFSGWIGVGNKPSVWLQRIQVNICI